MGCGVAGAFHCGLRCRWCVSLWAVVSPVRLVVGCSVVHLGGRGRNRGVCVVECEIVYEGGSRVSLLGIETVKRGGEGLENLRV